MLIFNLNNQLTKKIFLLNERILPSLITATFGSLFIDLFTYENFLAKLIFLGSSQLFIISFFSIFLHILNKMKKKSSVNNLLKLAIDLNSLVFPFLLVTSFFLYQLESENFPNYVFSEYHIHLMVLSKITFLSFFLVLYKNTDNMFFSKITKLLFKKKNIILEKKLFFIIAIFFVTYQVMIGFQRLFPWYILSIKHVNLTFEEKNKILFGNLYYQYNLINEFTPSDSKIAVPPQLFDGMIGNIGFSRYFVYPRYLFHPEDDEYSLQDADYVIISSILNNITESEFKNWPFVQFETDGGVSINKITNEINHINTTVYDPNSSIYSEKVTILKVKK